MQDKRDPGNLLILSITSLEKRHVLFDGTVNAGWAEPNLAVYDSFVVDFGFYFIEMTSPPVENGYHEYRVRACENDGCGRGAVGQWSETVSILVGLPPISGFSLSDENPSMVTIA